MSIAIVYHYGSHRKVKAQIESRAIDSEKWTGQDVTGSASIVFNDFTCLILKLKDSRPYLPPIPSF